MGFDNILKTAEKNKQLVNITTKSGDRFEGLVDTSIDGVLRVSIPNFAEIYLGYGDIESLLLRTNA